MEKVIVREIKSVSGTHKFYLVGDNKLNIITTYPINEAIEKTLKKNKKWVR